MKLKSKELFENENGFDSILQRYGYDTEKLRKDLINTHTAIHFTDFLTTNLMVASIPWLGNLLTKYRTKRSGYSGTYKMADEDFTKKAAEKHDKTKKLRQIATFSIALLPALTIPALVRKGLLKGNNKNSNRILQWFNKHAKNFDYKNSIYMSRLTALAMWIASDWLPYQLACRDKYEYRDTLIRGTSIGLVFWGGDLFLKRLMAKTSDKLFKTHLINKDLNSPYSLSELKNYKNIANLNNISEKTMKKTKNAAVGLYVLNLGLIMATLGFGLPAALNKLLKKRVSEDKMNELHYKNSFSNSFIKPKISDFV